MSFQSLLSYRSGLDKAALHPVSSLRLLPPVVLKILAGEFKGLASDFMLFDLAAQLGTEIRGREGGTWRVVPKNHDWDIIHKLFVNTQALDPYFKQTYVLAQGWLPWKPAGMVDETNDILQTALENRPWDWEPLRFQGFNSYYFHGDRGKAGKLYLQAAQVPNSPPFLTILGGRLAQEGGETETAIMLMGEMLKNAEHAGSENTDIVDRLAALKGTLIIERAVQKYEQQLDQIPEAAEELTHVGILDELPLNPYNLAYCIDQNGLVYFDRPNCRETGN